MGCRAQFAVVVALGCAALIGLVLTDSILYSRTRDFLMASSVFAAEEASLARVALVNGTGIPTDVNVTVTYRVENGLFNQFFAHLSALMIARDIGAELVLPYAMARYTFNVSDFRNNQFRIHDPSWLLDVDATTRRCHEMGVPVEQGWTQFIKRLYPTGKPPEYRYRHEEALMSTLWERDDLLPVSIKQLTYRTLTLKEVHSKVRREAAGAAQRRVESGRDLSRVKHVIIFLGNPMYTVNIHSSPSKAQEAFWAFRFAPQLATVAARALRELRLLSGPAAGPYRNARFNAVHLRLEPDSQHWARDFGGYDALKNSYRQYMDAAGFDPATPLYVSTALTSPTFKEQWETARREVLDGRGNPVIFKESLLDADDLNGLDPEQLAVVDFLVATQATRFVGFARSSFSLMLSQHLFMNDAEKTMLIPPPDFENTPYFAGGIFTAQPVGLPADVKAKLDAEAAKAAKEAEAAKAAKEAEAAKAAKEAEAAKAAKEEEAAKAAKEAEAAKAAKEEEAVKAEGSEAKPESDAAKPANDKANPEGSEAKPEGDAAKPADDGAAADVKPEGGAVTAAAIEV